MGKSLLFYNLYPKEQWKEITASLLRNVPHDDITVHVALPLLGWFNKGAILIELERYPKIQQVIFSNNKKKIGEAVGLEKLQSEVDLEPYSILTYIHSKGSSKARKNTQPIMDWTEYMRYFVVERLDKAVEAFENGFYLYGVNLSTSTPSKDKTRLKHPRINFHYSGNFVSINLKELGKKLLITQCVKDYYGVELFWGRLCTIDKAYSAHESGVDHYNQPYPPDNYLAN